MPLGNIIKAGMKMKEAYDSGMRGPKGSDPEIPVPGRTKLPPPPVPTNQSRANAAADMLNVPGRDVVRGAMAKRKKMLDEL